MKPLVITFDHSFPLSEAGEWNLMEVPKKLDCDHIRFTLGNGIRNALCKKGSEVNGDFCWHCHNGVGALPARISQQWDVPLQIWGEPTAKYGGYGAYKYEDLEEQNEEHFKKVFQLGITPKMVKPDNYQLVDLMPMTWPGGKFPLKALYLGNYELWDQRKHVEIITKELGWKHSRVEGTYVDWDKVDCPYEPVRDWQKFMKRGFGRTAFQASKDIREGLINRQNALKLIEKHDGKRPKILNNFLKETGMTEKEFNEITLKHKVLKENKIEGQRIYLKPLSEKNATQEYCAWLNDPVVNKFLETRKTTIRDLKKYIQKQIEDPNSFFVGIFDKKIDRHIGNIKLEPIDWKRKKAVFGILIGDKNYWGKGIGTEATKLIVNYAFNQMGLQEIELGVIAENLAAIRAYEKVGFETERIEKKAIRHGKKLFDKLIMSIKK